MSERFLPVNTHLWIMLEGVAGEGGILYRGNVLQLFGHDAPAVKYYWNVCEDLWLSGKVASKN